VTPSVTIRRRVQWIDTDAAGIWHHSVIIRWVEEAEAELHRRLGIIEQTFGATPRVRTEFDFAAALRFDDEVEITLSVEALGETSITYGVEARTKDGPIVNGRMIAVLIDTETGMKTAWPEELRVALSSK
jgi:acyl-CoA thioester hydrolase